MINNQLTCIECELDFDLQTRFPFYACKHNVCLRCVYLSFKKDKKYICSKCNEVYSYLDEFSLRYDFHHFSRRHNRIEDELKANKSEWTDSAKQKPMRTESLSKLFTIFKNHLPPGLKDETQERQSKEDEMQELRKYRLNLEEEVLHMHEDLLDEIDDLEKARNKNQKQMEKILKERAANEKALEKVRLIKEKIQKKKRIIERDYNIFLNSQRNRDQNINNRVRSLNLEMEERRRWRVEKRNKERKEREEQRMRKEEEKKKKRKD